MKIRLVNVGLVRNAFHRILRHTSDRPLESMTDRAADGSLTVRPAALQDVAREIIETYCAEFVRGLEVSLGASLPDIAARNVKGRRFAREAGAGA